MRKFSILVLCLFLLFSIMGCSIFTGKNKTSTDTTYAKQNPISDTTVIINKDMNKYDSNTIASKEVSEKKKVAKNLIDKMNLLIEKIKNNKATYDLVELSVIINQLDILKMSYLDSNSINSIEDARKYILELKNSPIYSALSLDGDLFIAIVNSNDKLYENSINKIRKLDDISNNNEYTFLNDINNQGFYIIDLYVDNIFNSDKKVTINNINLLDVAAFQTDKSNKPNISIGSHSNDFWNTISKYKDRNYTKFINDIKNKSWSLVAFDNISKPPLLIAITTPEGFFLLKK